jgi:hypothetical protein
MAPAAMRVRLTSDIKRPATMLVLPVLSTLLNKLVVSA